MGPMSIVVSFLENMRQWTTEFKQVRYLNVEKQQGSQPGRDSLATLLLNAAAACMWPLTTVYMHNELHQTLTLAGIALLGMSCA